jgi:hypothetical protein
MVDVASLVLNGGGDGGENGYTGQAWFAWEKPWREVEVQRCCLWVMVDVLEAKEETLGPTRLVLDLLASFAMMISSAIRLKMT